ncbi:MAG: S66 peptidase family protein [Lachnospiraceae bacterium]
MIYPKYLNNNSIIGITAPSDGRSDSIDLIRLDNAVRQFEARGIKVKETAHVRCSENGRSCDGKTRAAELHELFLDEDCDLILSASGGDWLFEMLPYVDYDLIKNNPKWFEGMSDPTGLTYTITTMCEVATVYCANAGEFGMEEWDETLENNIRILSGEPSMVQKSTDSYQSGWSKYVYGNEGYAKDSKTKWRCLSGEQEVKTTGRLLGGCLDVLACICGTRFDKTKEFLEKYKEDGFLWYLEVFSMTPEQLAFTLWQLKEAGWFRYIKGILFGRPAMIHDEYSSISYEEAVMTVLGELHCPVIADMDFGHRPPHHTIVNGAVGTVSYKDGAGSFSMEFS